MYAYVTTPGYKHIDLTNGGDWAKAQMESNHIVMDVLRHVDGLVRSLQTSLITRRHQTPQPLKTKLAR